jgi:hypothetical protein
MLWVREPLSWELRWHCADSLAILQGPAHFPGARHWVDNTYETGGGDFIISYNSSAYTAALGLSALNGHRKTYPTSQS